MVRLRRIACLEVERSSAGSGQSTQVVCHELDGSKIRPVGVNISSHVSPIGICSLSQVHDAWFLNV